MKYTSSETLSGKYDEELLKIDSLAMAEHDIRYVTQGVRGFCFQQVEGVDWNQFAAMNDMHLVAGRAPEGVNEVVVDETKAANNKLSVGSQIKLFGNQPYTVTGVYTPEAGPRVKMSLTAMQDALEAPGKCTW